MSERMRIDGRGNVKIAGIADRSAVVGTNALHIFDGDSPPGNFGQWLFYLFRQRRVIHNGCRRERHAPDTPQRSRRMDILFKEHGHGEGFTD